MVARGDQYGYSIIILSDQGPEGYGPLGTPNRGRAERISRSDREAARRYRAAVERLQRDADSVGAAEIRSLRAENHRLGDQLDGLRRELAQLRAEQPDRISQQLADKLPEAHDYLHSRTEVLRNGTQGRR